MASENAASAVKMDPERGSFVNGRGLRLERYTWRASALKKVGFGSKPPAGSDDVDNVPTVVENASTEGAKDDELPPAAIVVFVHGYCVHARYEALLPEYEGAPGHEKYEGSITHRLNEVGCDVHAFDLQGHGLSEKLKGAPCYADDFDDFPKDVIQFASLVKKEYASSDGKGAIPPVYIVGASMGGLVTLRVIQMEPKIADGICLLAPAIMMLDEESYCCWYWLKKPILHTLKPILKKVPMIHRYRATDKHMKYTEGADPLNYWGLMHFGMAANMMEGQLRCRGGRQIEVPYIILSSPNDTHVNSMGSHDMFQQTTSKDKTLCWMNNMGHSLLYEPPGCEQVIKLTVNWILERANPGSVQNSDLYTSERSGGYTVRRSVG